MAPRFTERTAAPIPIPSRKVASRTVVGCRSRSISAKRALVSSMAFVSARVQESNFFCQTLKKRSTPIHPYPTTVSTTMMGPKADWGVSTLSAMATMLAVPPIQLPERAANPFQASSGSAPPKIISETGPPMMIPTVPAVTMKSATGPNLATLFRSMEIMRRKRARGRKYRVVKS